MNKRYVILIMIVALTALAACGGKEDVEPTQEEIIEKEVEKRVAEEQRLETYQQTKEDKEEYSIAEVLDIIKADYQESNDIHYSEETSLFLITPTDPQFTQEMENLLDGQTNTATWYERVEKVRSLSESVTEMLGDDYGIVLNNPENKDNMLIWAQDGKVLYEMLEDESANINKEENADGKKTIDAKDEIIDAIDMKVSLGDINIESDKLKVSINIENTRDSELTFYPDQGSAVIDDIQLDANRFLTDGQVGGKVQGGVKQEGILEFLVPEGEVIDVKNINEIELTLGDVTANNGQFLTSQLVRFIVPVQ